jgi:hypothetical protein
MEPETKSETQAPRGRYSPETIMALTDLFGRYLSMRGVQQTAFQGERDYYTVLGYPAAPSFADYESLYRRQDIARPVVNAKPNDTWKDPPQLRFIKGAKSTTAQQKEFLKEWEALVKRVRLWDRIRHADVRAGLGQYAVIVLGFRGRGQWPAPLPKKTAVGDLVYLAVYDEPEAVISTFVTDMESERFNLPEFYTIQTGNNQEQLAGATTSGVLTHWSRVIHVVEDPDDDVYGSPRLEVVYNLLAALMKTVHGAAEAIWHDMVGTFHADVREGYELTTDDEATLTDAIDEFIHGLRRVIRTEGIDLTKLEGKVIDPSGIFEVIIQLIASATQIPRTILVGSDRGDVSKTEETRRWAAVIDGRRKSFAEPLIRTFMERLVDYGSLPQIEVDDIEFVWSTLFELSELERAQIAEARGRAVSAVSLGSSADIYVSPTEFREWIGLDARLGKDGDAEEIGIRALLAKITQSLYLSGASTYAAALTAGFSEEEAKGLSAWASPLQPPIPEVPSATSPTETTPVLPENQPEETTNPSIEE